jgi:hypothetical protein
MLPQPNQSGSDISAEIIRLSVISAAVNPFFEISATSYQKMFYLCCS